MIGLLARKIGQPMVIAEVVAGILLGPSFFGLFFPLAKETIFPNTDPAMLLLNMFSQVGLVFFMFLIGLELDPKLLSGRGRASVIISHSSIVAPFALGALLALFLPSWLSASEKPMGSFMLFMGVAMSITAFPVLARILAERRLLRTKIGAITIACAAVDDVTAWCILGFVVSIVNASGLAGAVRTCLFALLFILFMVFGVRPFLARMGSRTDNRSGLTPNLVAVTFVLLLLSSLVTELIGIHALFGAFLFGAIMPRDGGYTHALAEKLEDFVVVFLLPLFFAYSGLRTQINLLNTGEAWMYCGLITLLACLGKFGGSAIAARLTGLSWRESTGIGILMNTRGLMELIVLNIGLDLKVLSPALFTMMVIMALITTFMTTPMLQLFYSQSDLENELLEPAEAADKAEGTFNILMCVAHEKTGPVLATMAAALAGKDPAHGRMFALRLIPPPERTSFYVNEETEESGDDTGNALIPLLERSEQLGLKVKPLSFVSNDPGDDICQVGRLKKADLILLGWHRPLLNRSLLAGIVYDVMTDATSDVGVVIDRGLASISRILLPYNGSPHDHAALKMARRLHDKSGAHVTILHVTAPNRAAGSGLNAKEHVHSVFKNASSINERVVMKVVVHENAAAAAIAEAACGYDLVVIGSGPDWGLEQRQFGLHPEAIILESPASLLVVRQYDAKRHANA